MVVFSTPGVFSSRSGIRTLIRVSAACLFIVSVCFLIRYSILSFLFTFRSLTVSFIEAIFLNICLYLSTLELNKAQKIMVMAGLVLSAIFSIMIFIAIHPIIGFIGSVVYLIAIAQLVSNRSKMKA